MAKKATKSNKRAKPKEATEQATLHKGIFLNPTYNFELLKQTRHTLFEKAKEDFIAEQKNLPTKDFELNSFYVYWLEKELKNSIANWLSDTYPNGAKKRKQSASELIEIKKYKDFVTKEIEKTEALIIRFQYNGKKTNA